MERKTNHKIYSMPTVRDLIHHIFHFRTSSDETADSSMRSSRMNECQKLSPPPDDEQRTFLYDYEEMDILHWTSNTYLKYRLS